MLNKEYMKTANCFKKTSYEEPDCLDYLRSYLSDTQEVHQIPLLFGKSISAKLTAVKIIADELNKKYNGHAPNYGIRLVNVRASFMEELISEKLQKEHSNRYGYDPSYLPVVPPMAKLVECTDGYIAYCREALGLINEKLAQLTGIDVLNNKTSSDVSENISTDEQEDAELDFLWETYVKNSYQQKEERTRATKEQTARIKKLSAQYEAKGMKASIAYQKARNKVLGLVDPAESAEAVDSPLRKFGLPEDFKPVGTGCLRFREDTEKSRFEKEKKAFIKLGYDETDAITRARYKVFALRYNVKLHDDDISFLLNAADSAGQTVNTNIPDSAGKKDMQKNNGSGNDVSKQEKIKQLLIMRKKFVEGAKIPLLVFDEIICNTKYVVPCLMEMITRKEYRRCDMKIARIVIIPDTRVLYQSDSEGFPNVYDGGRYSSIPINPEDVFELWKRWAWKMHNDRQNVHKLVMEYVINPGRPEDTGLVYDLDGTAGCTPDSTDAVNAGDEQMDSDETEQKELYVSFPNFRTWEMVSDILFANENKKSVSLLQIKGLLGKRAGSLFGEYLEKNGWIISGALDDDVESDPLLDLMNACVDTGTPTLLVAPLSTGKRSRVINVAEKHGAEFVEASFAMHDSDDLFGKPLIFNIDDRIASMLNGADDAMKKELKDLFKKYRSKLPETVVSRITNLSVAEKFVKAVTSGRKVVLLIDEVHRALHSAEISVLIEAASDHIIFGYDYSKYAHNVRVICSCHSGIGKGLTQKLKQRLSLRFAVYRKHTCDMQDVHNFIKYAKEQQFEPEIVQFLEENKESKDGNESLVLQMLKSVYRRTLFINSASATSIATLNEDIKSSKQNSSFRGCCLVPPNSKFKQVAAGIMSGNVKELNAAEVDAFFAELDRKLDNWCGRYCTARNRPEIEDLVYNYKLARENGVDGNDIVAGFPEFLKDLKMIIDKDLSMQALRLKSVEYSIGSLLMNGRPINEIFGEFYNNVSGTIPEEVNVNEITVDERIEPYIDFALRKFKGKPLENILAILKEVIEFDPAHTQVNYRKLFYGSDGVSGFGTGGVMYRLANADTRRCVLQEMCKSEKTIELLIMLENREADYIHCMTTNAGFQTDKTEIEKYLKETDSAVSCMYFR